MSQEKWQSQIVQTYGTSDNFLKTFNPDLQSKCITFLDRSFVGSAPSLTRIKITYKKEIAEIWIVVQLTDLFDFCGIKDKLTSNTIEILANVILTNYGYLKVTELMVFFQKFKAGEYGKFYGVIDPLLITDALNQFLKFRYKKIDEYQKIKEREERELRLKNAITYDDYLRLKQKYEQDK